MRGTITDSSGEKSAKTIIFIVIGIICAVSLIGTVVFAGITFLWASSFTEEAGGEVMTFRLDGDIDATEDLLEFTVLSGKVIWGDYFVKVDGMTMSTEAMETFASGTAIFISSEWDPQPGTVYEVTIVEIAQNRIIWEHSIIATP